MQKKYEQPRPLFPLQRRSAAFEENAWRLPESAQPVAVGNPLSSPLAQPAASFVDAAAGAMAGKAVVYSGQQQRYVNETLMESEDALEKAFHSFTTLGFREDGTRSL